MLIDYFVKFTPVLNCQHARTKTETPLAYDGTNHIMEKIGTHNIKTQVSSFKTI